MGVIFATCTDVVLAAVAALLFTAVLLVRHQFAYWQRRCIPSAMPRFPMGNFTECFLQRRSLADDMQALYHSTVEPVLGTYFMLRPTLLLIDPELVRAVCIKDFVNFPDRGVYSEPDRDPLSGNLFQMKGPKWHQVRGKLSPTFTSGKLKAMFGTLVDSGEPLRRFVAAAAVGGNDQVIEMRELLSQFTTNVIASAAFGLDIDCIGRPDTTFRRIGRKILAPTLWNSLRSLFSLLFPSMWSRLRLKSVDADVEEFFMSVVKQNIEHRETKQVVRKDFFQLLMQLRNGGLQADGVWELGDTVIAGGEPTKKQLSLDECAAQSYAFFLAGFETTASTVSFALYELAKNPECQLRVQREIDEVLARHGGEVTYDAVAELKYMDWCLDETLRKYPPLPMLQRQSVSDWCIPNTNMTIEGGTLILIPVHALQMDPKYYPEPERFLPERFDPQHEAFSANRPYLPFGEGPRNCIGMRLGKIQSKVGLLSMLRDHSYELSGNTKRKMVFNPSSFLLAPLGGVNLRTLQRIRA